MIIPDIDSVIAPDLQKILLFVLPTIALISSLTMNLSRGFSTVGTVFMILCGLVALYFLPQFLEVF